VDKNGLKNGLKWIKKSPSLRFLETVNPIREREREENKIPKYRNFFSGIFGFFNPGFWILLDKPFNRNWEKQAQNGLYWVKNGLYWVKIACFGTKIIVFNQKIVKITVFNQKKIILIKKI